MVPHRFAPRVTNCFCLALPVLFLLACTRQPPEPSKKKPAEITLPKTGSQAGFDQIEKDLTQYGLGPVHIADCTGCSKRDAVTIRSTGLTKDIKGTIGPAKLRIVALINNQSNEDVDHTPSGKTFKANTKYLMWASSQADKKAIWGFIELGPGYDATPKKIGLLQNCGHGQDSVTKIDDAKFRDCGDKSVGSRWIKTAYAAPARKAAPTINKPGWVACDPDCCTGTVQ